MKSSLSADTKDAVSRDAPLETHCRAALRRGLELFSSVDPLPGLTSVALTFRTQRLAIARLFRALGDGDGPIKKIAGTRLHKVPVYAVNFTPGAGAALRPAQRCDRRMEIRAAFLACGSLAAPSRGYHLEFVPPSEQLAERLLRLLRADGRHPKIGLRKAQPLVYFKDIEEITQVLASIGAFTATLHMEDIRALKETKNRIHRLVNTEAANLERAASAAAAQRDAIEFLADAYGLSNLPAQLREIARRRQPHPTDTLTELGRRCQPPAGKSTVGVRLAAVLRLAGRLRAPQPSRTDEAAQSPLGGLGVVPR